MSQPLSGKTALVTGSTSGIGLGIARALAEAGAAVMLNGFGDAAEIEARRAALAEEFGVPVAHDPADVTDAEAVARIVARTQAELGGPHILVNNAGIQHVAPVEAFPIARWDAVIATNLSAAFYATRAALPGMRAAGWGRIVNIASAHGLVASVEKSAYVAAKHGVVGLTKTVALETAGSFVTCNAICPGFVLTALVRRQIEDKAAERDVSFEKASESFLAKHPSGRFVTPEQIGALALFLCGEAAAEITGASLSMDAGWTAQ